MIAWRIGLLVALIGACKTRGTIEVAFGQPPPCVRSAEDAIVYAEPNQTCAGCLCGMCFGATSDGVNGCPEGFCGVEAGDLELDLQPGHWAIVRALLDGNGVQIASGCVEVDVDADGVGSAKPDAGMMTPCEPACSTQP